MVLRQRGQGAQRARQHVRVDRLVPPEDLDRKNQSLGSRPRRLETFASSSAVEVGPVGQGSSRHERE